MRGMKALALILIAIGCSSNGGGEGPLEPDAQLTGPDAKVFLDAPANVPAMLTLSGTTSERGLSGTSNTAGVTLTAHRVSDDMKLSFNWAAAAKFARINYLIARDLADGAVEPRWYEGDYFGEQFAKGAARATR